MPAGTSTRGWIQQGAVWGNMLGKNIMPGDEELGKKDDDHKAGTASRMPSWSFLHIPLRWRRRRILLAAVALYVLYMLLGHTSSMAQWRSKSEGWQFELPIAPAGGQDYDKGFDVEPTGMPEGTKAPKKGEPNPHTYSGLIKFYRLANSLQGASYTHGYAIHNTNVLFAASNLQSAATLLPVVCEMARWNRNFVHMAFMGREDIDVGKILEINGIDQIKCPVIWHDARPDYSEYSTDTRAESSVRAAMAHIHSYLHPQVVIVDNAVSEDDFFVRGIRTKAQALDMPVIEGPQDRWDNFMWTARLDAASLRSWHKPKVEILIQVPQDSSSVIRLLKSIKSADYSGLNLPHITIELPARIDGSVQNFLRDFRWPPTGDSSHISITRRVTSRPVDQEESTIRFLELFYPTDPGHSHVLLLSPQAELSSQYYQYLTYVLLEYKYSQISGIERTDLMGISLELPSVLLDGQTKLTAPKVPDMQIPRYHELYPETRSVPFLWQAPNSHAALFFGEKWVELHSFFANRLSKHIQDPAAAPRKKFVSETLPSWMETMLEYMRARGYALFYPGSTSAESFVTVHNEFYRAPEEFLTPKLPKTTKEIFDRADEPAAHPKLPEANLLPASTPLHLVLPFNGDMPEIATLPYMLHSGRLVPPENATDIAATYADAYREVIGGCKPIKGKHRKYIPGSGSARDLFCFGDEGEDAWEDDAPAIVELNDGDDALPAWMKGGDIRLPGGSSKSLVDPAVASYLGSKMDTTLTNNIPTPTHTPTSVALAASPSP
jgi:hypothetical protein